MYVAIPRRPNTKSTNRVLLPTLLTNPVKGVPNVTMLPAGHRLRMQREFLDSPVQKLRDVNLVLRRTGDLMNPSELLGLLSRLAHHSENLALQRELIQSARICVGREQHLVQAGSYADRPGCAVLRRSRVTRRHVALRRARRRIEGHIDRHPANECAVRIEYLNAPVAAIRDVDVPLCVGSDAVRRVEFAGLGSAIAPLFHPGAVLVELGHARVDVPVADEDIAFGIPRHIRWLAE